MRIRWQAGNKVVRADLAALNTDLPERAGDRSARDMPRPAKQGGDGLKGKIMDDFTRLDYERQLLAVRCDIESMVAENEIRRSEGKALAYGEDAFASVKCTLDVLRDTISP
jgi:hypothetical protein